MAGGGEDRSGDAGETRLVSSEQSVGTLEGGSSRWLAASGKWDLPPARQRQ